MIQTSRSCSIGARSEQKKNLYNSKYTKNINKKNKYEFSLLTGSQVHYIHQNRVTSSLATQLISDNFISHLFGCFFQKENLFR